MIGSKANTDELIYQSKYIDLPEASNADRQTDTDGIKRDHKDWNFGLAEYSDTVGPPGGRFFCIQENLHGIISGLNFLLNGETGRVRKCMWLIMMVIGSIWCVRNVRSGLFKLSYFYQTIKTSTYAFVNDSSK